MPTGAVDVLAEGFADRGLHFVGDKIFFEFDRLIFGRGLELSVCYRVEDDEVYEE